MTTNLNLHLRKYPMLQFVFYGTYADKAGIIAQRRCHICSIGRPMDEMIPIHTLSLRSTPISRQAAGPGVFKAFKRALRAYFSERERNNAPIDLGPTGRIYMSFTFILNEHNNNKDLDSMTKALLDALAQALKFNDRHVHHLNVAKLIFAGIEEYVFVHLAPSALNEHSDVMASIMNISWPGRDRIDLADFMEEGPGKA